MLEPRKAKYTKPAAQHRLWECPSSKPREYLFLEKKKKKVGQNNAILLCHSSAKQTNMGQWKIHAPFQKLAEDPAKQVLRKSALQFARGCPAPQGTRSRMQLRTSSLLWGWLEGYRMRWRRCCQKGQHKKKRKKLNIFLTVVADFHNPTSSGPP